MRTPTYISGSLQVQAHRILQAQLQATLHAHGLNPTQWFLLGYIYDHRDSLRLADLASLLAVEAPLISMLVNPLIQQNLLQKIPHPTDKRAKVLALTARGKELVLSTEMSLQQTLTPLTRGITSQEMESYYRVLRILVSNGKHIPPRPDPSIPLNYVTAKGG